MPYPCSGARCREARTRNSPGRSGPGSRISSVLRGLMRLRSGLCLYSGRVYSFRARVGLGQVRLRGPAIFHVPGGLVRRGAAEETSDDVERPVDTGGDPGGRHDLSVVYEAATLLDRPFRERGAEAGGGRREAGGRGRGGGRGGEVGGGRLPIEDAERAENEGAVADGEGNLRGIHRRFRPRH